MGGYIKNTDFKRDSGEVKGCNQRGRPCTARLEGPSCVTLQHSEGIRLTTYQLPFRRHFGTRPTRQLILASLQASLHAHTRPPYTALGMYHTMKFSYGVDNPGEFELTADGISAILDLCQLCM